MENNQQELFKLYQQLKLVEDLLSVSSEEYNELMIRLEELKASRKKIIQFIDSYITFYNIKGD